MKHKRRDNVGYVYELRSDAEGCFYIGTTIDPTQRFRQHRHRFKHYLPFTLNVLLVSDREMMKVYESLLIARLDDAVINKRREEAHAHRWQQYAMKM